MIDEILIHYGEVVIVVMIWMYYSLLGAICLGLARYVRRRAAREYDQDTRWVRQLLTDLLRGHFQLSCGVEGAFK